MTATAAALRRANRAHRVKSGRRPLSVIGEVVAKRHAEQPGFEWQLHPTKGWRRYRPDRPNSGDLIANFIAAACGRPRP